MDVATLRMLLKDAEAAEAIQGIERGLKSFATGGGRPAEAALADIRSRYGISCADRDTAR
jgi:hypothetical protein